MMRIRLLVVCASIWSVTLNGQSPVTVDDMIAIRAVGAPDVGEPTQDVGVFSPDGQRFAIVVREPDLERNVVRSLLLVFRTDSVFRGGRPDTALVLASGSNTPAISQVSLLTDNDTVMFLGARDTTAPQVYRFNLRTRGLTPVTHVATGIERFEVAARTGTIVYEAEAAPDSAFLRRAAATGFFVDPEQYVEDLMVGRWDKGRGGASPLQQFVLSAEAERGKRLTAADGCYSLALAPDGRRGVASCPVSRRPVQWARFTDSTSGNIRETQPYALHVIDFATDSRRLLIDAPSSDFESFTWARDGRSVVVANGFLPTPDPARQRAWYGLLDVDVQSGAVTPIYDGDTVARPVWNPATHTVSARRGLLGGGSAVTFEWRGERWVAMRVGGDAAGESRANGRLRFLIAQDINTPPTIVASDPETGRQVVLLDLNPQLRRLRLARVEMIHVVTSYGDTVAAEVYIPPDLRTGERHPLVIQAHGFRAHEFALDGLYRTGKAAQALAAHGIVVAQVDYVKAERQYLMTYREPLSEIAAVTATIDTLDRRGLIDRQKVGMVGFSRGCWQVEYLITHPDPSHPIAAASITDGVDYGYYQYVTWGGLGDSLEYRIANGGPPYDGSLARWVELTPGFNVNKVHAALLITALGSLLSQREIYVGLVRQHKAVELLDIPNGSHLLFRPWDLRASQQTTVDWFAFWLKGEEDPDPSKAEQYRRWRALR